MMTGREAQKVQMAARALAKANEALVAYLNGLPRYGPGARMEVARVADAAKRGVEELDRILAEEGRSR